MGHGSSKVCICCFKRLGDDKIPLKFAHLPCDEAGEEVYTQSKALVFIKPHATMEAVKALVVSQFQAFGLRVLADVVITGDSASLSGVVDRHFGVIATKAVKLKPHELLVKPKKQEDFKRLFGLSWAQALQKKLLVNAMDALQQLELSQEEFIQKYDRLNRTRDEMKLGDGVYCGRVDGLYVINGFYLRLRALYTTADIRINYFEVTWPTPSLSWSQLRKAVIGDTDPAKAQVGSLREKVFRDWGQLGLASPPNINDNIVHISASSFESMVERANWFGRDILGDPLARALRDKACVPLKTLNAWFDDPTIMYGKQRSTLFDVLADLNAQQCVETAAQIIFENS